MENVIRPYFSHKCVPEVHVNEIKMYIYIFMSVGHVHGHSPNCLFSEAFL